MSQPTLDAMSPTSRDRSPHSPTVPAAPLRVALTLFLLAALPPLVYYFWICLQYFGGRLVFPTPGLLHYFPRPTATSAGILASWLVFQALLQIYAPGQWTEGMPLPGGSGARLHYKMNGWVSWWITWIVLAAAMAVGAIPPTLLADQFGPLMTTANIFTFVFCVYLYRRGKAADRAGRITGNAVEDFWLGKELNPRLGTFDLKLFRLPTGLRTF
jgi:Delta24(24(1))-sterol reductase